MRRLRSLRREPARPTGAGDAIANLRRSLDPGGAGPVVCGPFLGEPGFETLYWAPFLRNYAGPLLAGGRDVVLISRGGTERLYADLIAAGARYVDVLDVLTVEGYLELERERLRDDPKAKNQKRTSEVEERVLAAAGLGERPTLLPSHMFALLRRNSHEQVCDWGAWPPASPLEGREDRTVLKFWFGGQLPPTPTNVEAIKRWIERFAEAGPVVALLNPHSLETEPAMDSPFDTLVGQMGLPTLTASSARTNIGEQIEAIERSTRFVSTYGGLAYLSLYTNTPLVSFYSEPRIVFSPHFSNFATAVSGRNAKAADSSLPVSLIDLQTI